MANVLQHVLAFLPNLFGFLMHRGGRDARVPVRCRFAAIVGNSRRVAINTISAQISSVASYRR
ncbi:MAG: hypothetical protein LBQ66_03095 [Planctomycetaceae bacterium]|nr:hypothetical protein [Planctomycetaceae bacterium]